MKTARRGERRRIAREDIGTTMENEGGDIEHEAVRATETETDAIDTATAHARAIGGETTIVMADGGSDPGAASTSDEKTARNVGANATTTRGSRGHVRGIADATERLGAGRHTRGMRGGRTEAKD